MCGRVNIIDGPLAEFILAIIEQAGLKASLPSDGLPHFATRYNIAPTESVEVLRVNAEWQLTPMRWWLVPRWVSEPSTRYSMFNAKAETLASSRAYADSFKARRCIVPVSGYYEWRTENGVKTPYYIQARDANGLALAGLWDRWEKGGQVIESCTVITTAAPEVMAGIHHRMPVALSLDEAGSWLDESARAADLQAMLAPQLQTPLLVTPVSTYVNNARHKDPGCIEPTGKSVTITPTDLQGGDKPA